MIIFAVHALAAQANTVKTNHLLASEHAALDDFFSAAAFSNTVILGHFFTDNAQISYKDEQQKMDKKTFLAFFDKQIKQEQLWQLLAEDERELRRFIKTPFADILIFHQQFKRKDAAEQVSVSGILRYVDIGWRIEELDFSMTKEQLFK